MSNRESLRIDADGRVTDDPYTGHIRLRPEPPTEAERRETYEARRLTPLGGKAHEHQVITPHCWRPRFVKARRMPRAIAKGGGLWWRVRMEALTLKRKAARGAVV
jgi:hypothetical protein